MPGNHHPPIWWLQPHFFLFIAGSPNLFQGGAGWERIPRLPVGFPLYKAYRNSLPPWPWIENSITFFRSKSESRGPGAVSMIRKNSRAIDWYSLAAGAIWKVEEGEGGGEAQSKRELFLFIRTMKAKEVDMKGENSSNGRKSKSKSREAGAPRQGVTCPSPQPLSPSRAALRSNN